MMDCGLDIATAGLGVSAVIIGMGGKAAAFMLGNITALAGAVMMGDEVATCTDDVANKGIRGTAGTTIACLFGGVSYRQVNQMLAANISTDKRVNKTQYTI
jgi:superfamily II DNA/RNA helicase